MLGLAGVPSLIMFFGFLFMPESPRWLVFKGKMEKAKRALSKVRQLHEVDEELRAIQRDHEDHKRTQRSMCTAIFFCISQQEHMKGEGVYNSHRMQW